jgi:drug/metabolite transporter (DMT)-like permease
MVTAQSLWKIGLARIGTIDVSQGWLPQIAKLIRSWRIVVGLGIFGLTSLMWFDLLSRMELSLLYPMMSLVYVIAFFVGWWFLGETPNWSRLVGILVIGVGIFLVSRTGT